MAAQGVQIQWTEDELVKMAASNYTQHTGNIVMSGVTVVDIMPFGLSRHPDAIAFVSGLGDGAGVGAGVVLGGVPDLSFIQTGLFDHEDDLEVFSFGFDENEALPEPLVGLGTGQNVVAGPVDPVFDAQGFDLGVEEAKGGDDIDDDIFNLFDDPSEDDFLDNAQPVINERIINYANIRKVGPASFGIRRKEFFYAQLDRMFDTFIANEEVYSRYQLAATFAQKSTTLKYGQAIAVNFGTTWQDGLTRLEPWNSDVWDFDIHNPLNIEVDKPAGAKVITGNAVLFDSSKRRGEANKRAHFKRFIGSLKTSLDAKMPFSGDSGQGDADLSLMNLFLYKIKKGSHFRARAGGKGLYDISSNTSLSASFSVKSVVTPPRSAENLCFWHCLYHFLFLRYKETGVLEGKWYDEYLKEGMIAWMRARTARRNSLNKTSRHFPRTIRKRYMEMKGLEVNNEMVPLESFDSILKDFGCENACVVLDVDGEALMGDLVGVENRRCEDNLFTALYFDEHLHLIMSYTGSLVVKRCRRCDERFTAKNSLDLHLKKGKCMTCVCKSKNETFASEEEWSQHMKDRSMTCPKFRMANLCASTVSSEAGDTKQLRFIQDKKDNYYIRKKKAQDAFDMDKHPMRVRKECIYFDLESVVPMNAAGVSVASHDFQTPYACGWILRSNILLNVDVSISYGLNCMKEFVDYLDGFYEEIRKDEHHLWMQRASDGVMADPTPKKSKGFTNYSHRVKKSWQLFMKTSESIGCCYCNELLEESHGYVVDSAGNHTFSHCAIRHYGKNVADKNLLQDFNGNAPRIPIWAHNGGKYDWLFLHRYLIEAGKLDELQTIRSNSKYYQLTYRGVFEFKDSLNFMMGSLDKLGKDFGVATLKGIFPYRLLASTDRIDWTLTGESEIREKIPHAFFQISRKLEGPMGVSVKRDMTEEEYVEFFQERGWVYSIRNETIKYLKDDVLCLYGVVEKFRAGWLNMPFSPELFKYCTIGQMCHSYFIDNYLKENMYPCLEVCEDAYIRKALYGGRTEVFQRFAPEGSRIHYVDVNSLYPHVMESRDLPCGDPTWHFRRDDPQVFEYMNSPFPIQTKIEDEGYFTQLVQDLNSNVNDGEIYGFLEVDVLGNLELEYPILPERRSMDGDKTFKNMFTNMHKKKMVYYSEELKRAVKKGYVVTKVWSFSQWKRGKVYCDLIKVLKEQKLLGEGKDVEGNVLEGVPRNPSLRAAAKTAQNSLFGKTIQFIDSHTQLVHTRERFFRLLDSPYSRVSVTPVFRSEFSDVVEITSKFMIPKVQKRSCAAIGTAILAEARLVLYDYFELVESIGGKILYCDTDSIVFSGENPLPQFCMDDSAYGMMKVEIDPDTIKPGGFVGMSPKCYAFDLVDDQPYVRFKGVVLSNNLNLPNERDGINDLLDVIECEDYIKDLSLPIQKDEVVSMGVSFQQMCDLVKGKTQALMMKQMQFRKTTDRMVSACEVVKLVRNMFDKRLVGDDGNTHAWNDFNMNMKEIVETENVQALSDYLGVVGVAELNYWRSQYVDNTFFCAIVTSWMDSQSPNALIYDWAGRF